MLRHLQRVAAAGYLALMPDLFSQGGPEPVAAADAWARIEALFAEHLH